MSKSADVVEAEISPELLAKIESVANVARRGTFTPEIDAAILKYWPIKQKRGLAKALGMAEERVRSRYRQLTEGQT
jgi:hypothetical protein